MAAQRSGVERLRFQHGKSRRYQERPLLNLQPHLLQPDQPVSGSTRLRDSLSAGQKPIHSVIPASHASATGTTSLHA